MSHIRFLKIKDEDVKRFTGKQILLLWLINRDWIPMKGYVEYKLSKICEELGFNPQSNTKKAFYEELIELEDFGIIEVEKNKAEVKIRYKKDEHGKTYSEQADTYFTILNEIDVAKILNLSCKCKPDTLVKVYVYLKSFIYASNELQYFVDRGIQDLGTRLVNKIRGKTIAEFEKATLKVEYTSSPSFDDFSDAIAKLNKEDDENAGLFCLVNPNMKSVLRKSLKDDFKYSEGYSRTGYIGTICGIPVKISKAVSDDTIIIASKKAVTCFVKKATETETDRDKNKRKNFIYSRIVNVVALTDAKEVVLIKKKVTTPETPSQSN